MEFIRQSIPEVILIKPKVFADNRGYFFESFNKYEFDRNVGKEIDFVQDNESCSDKMVLRGLHFQLPPFAQSKLVRVVEGEVLDVAVDIRLGSKTYGKYVSVILNDKNKEQLFIPRGFAHGFIVLSEKAIFAYKVDNNYSKEHDRGILFNDHMINIDWSVDIENIKLSEKDQRQPCLNNLKKELELFNIGNDLYE